jgi:hypothetical protein
MIAEEMLSKNKTHAIKKQFILNGGFQRCWLSFFYPGIIGKKFAVSMEI